MMMTSSQHPEPTHPTATPTLFSPLQIRNLHLRNRIVVSPMGTYTSYPTGTLTDFHLTHHGQFALRGAALTIVEVTAVLPNGRSSPSDAGLWSDAQIASFARVAAFVHALEPCAGGTAKIGIQLGHAGRKAGLMPIYPGKPVVRVGEEDGGWDAGEVWGPSAVPFKGDGVYFVPREMGEKEIEEVVRGFGEAARRAVEAGFDLIEVHGAHGYLISSFLSPASNIRTDAYGGPLQNRARLLFAVVRAIRANIPPSMPLSVRFSAADWMTHVPSAPQWTLIDSIELALDLADLGVDILDVSSGGNNAAQVVPCDAGYQVDLAAEIRRVLREQGKDMLVAGVGRITDAKTAASVVEGGKADLAFVGTEFLRDAGLVYRWAEELGVKVAWPRQYVRAERGRVTLGNV